MKKGREMKQRIALLSDVHGNSTALSAVVDDLKKRMLMNVGF